MLFYFYHLSLFVLVYPLCHPHAHLQIVKANRKNIFLQTFFFLTNKTVRYDKSPKKYTIIEIPRQFETQKPEPPERPCDSGAEQVLPMVLIGLS